MVLLVANTGIEARQSDRSESGLHVIASIMSTSYDV